MIGCARAAHYQARVDVFMSGAEEFDRLRAGRDRWKWIPLPAHVRRTMAARAARREFEHLRIYAGWSSTLYPWKDRLCRWTGQDFSGALDPSNPWW